MGQGRGDNITAEIITVKAEPLLGQTVDTNSDLIADFSGFRTRGDRKAVCSAAQGVYERVQMA
jgi:hypothetical protein